VFRDGIVIEPETGREIKDPRAEYTDYKGWDIQDTMTADPVSFDRSGAQFVNPTFTGYGPRGNVLADLIPGTIVVNLDTGLEMRVGHATDIGTHIVAHFEKSN
jgi:hypothetical protein